MNLFLLIAAVAATFGGKHATLEFDASGELASIRESGSGRELAGGGCPFMEVVLADGRSFPATSAVRSEDGGLVFGFRPLAGEIALKVTPFGDRDGWTFETTACTVKDWKTLTFAHVRPGCRKWYGDLACLVSDEKSGVALRAYDTLLRTAADDRPTTAPFALYDAPDLAYYPTKEMVDSGLMIRADVPQSAVGRRFGLCAGPRGLLKTMLRAMTFEAKVPHSVAGGAWAEDCEANRGSYLFTTWMTPASVEDWIELCRLGGFTTAHPYGWWQHYGDYTKFNPERMPNGLEDLRYCVDRFHEAGLRVDFHHLSHCVQYVTDNFLPEVKVDPAEVIMRCSYTLARPFRPGDTELYVNEKPWDGHNVIMKSHCNGNALIIGRELVQYHDMSWEKPYRFTKISRGTFKTQYFGDLPVKVSETTYPVGTPVHYPQQRYGSFYPKPGSAFMKKVSREIAAIFNECGGDGVYFDGAEGMMTRNGTEEGRKTTFELLKQKDDEIICESACLYPYSWWYRSRIGPWDHAEWGAKRFVDEHIRCLDEYARKANLLRVNLGWWSPMRGCYMARQHYWDEMEYNGMKGCAIDAADGFQIDVFHTNDKPTAFHTEQQLAIFGKWERVRLAKAFTDEAMAKIRVPGDEYRYSQRLDGEWRLAPQTVTAHAVKDAPYAKWTVESREERVAELRVEALYQGDGYTATNSFSLLAPADAAVLEKKTAAGVRLSVATARDAGKGETLVLEAENANGFSDGAWARAGRHYPVPYVAVENAVGLWVKGDGSGALLNVQIEQAIPCYHGYSEHYVRLDFTGWRYFALQLRERDAYDYFNHRWPYSHHRLNTATEVYRTEIMGRTVEYVNLYLNDIPAGGRCRVEVTDVRAIGRHENRFDRAVVSVNGREYRVPFAMKSTDTAELRDGVWTLIADDGQPVARAPFEGRMPRLREGSNEIGWKAEGPEYPRAEVTVTGVGGDFDPLRPGALGAREFRFEPELPVVYAPSRGFARRIFVPVRAGGRAKLRLRIVGPVKDPAVEIGGTRYVFPCELGENDVLRCSDGVRWNVRRYSLGKRDEIASGALPKPLPELTGTAEVEMSSAEDASARARFSFMKDYLE